MFNLENVGQWKGQNTIGADGEKIGKLQEVYVDTETDLPAFGAVQVGVVGKHRWAFVPLDGATAGRDYLRLRVTKKQVKDAPWIQPKGELPKDSEAAIYSYYGMAYIPTTALSGRRLARR
ncbi:MAG: PRC-barrel domain-containing protein [Actinocatenispora sp.]